MRLWHLNMTLLKVKQRHFHGDGHLDSSQFFPLLLRLKVFRSIALKYLHDPNTEYIDAAF